MRLVALQSVHAYEWATRALAWGVDTETGESVTFAVPIDRGRRLSIALEAGGVPVLSVNALDILFIRRSDVTDGPGAWSRWAAMMGMHRSLVVRTDQARTAFLRNRAACDDLLRATRELLRRTGARRTPA